MSLQQLCTFLGFIFYDIIGKAMKSCVPFIGVMMSGFERIVFLLLYSIHDRHLQNASLQASIINTCSLQCLSYVCSPLPKPSVSEFWSKHTNGQRDPFMGHEILREFSEERQSGTEIHVYRSVPQSSISYRHQKQ